MSDIREQLDKTLEYYFFPEDVARNDSNDGYIKAATKDLEALIQEQVKLARIAELKWVKSKSAKHAGIWVDDRNNDLDERLAELKGDK